MRLIFILLLQLGFINCIIGQAPEILWQRSFGGSCYDGAYSISPTKDNGFIICGGSCSQDINGIAIRGGHDFYIIKINSSGEIEWQKLLGAPTDDGAYDIKETSDGGFVVVGNISGAGKDVTKFYSKHDGWVVKLDAKGSIKWQRTFGDWDWNRLRSVNETSDHGFIIAGWTEGPHAWAIRIDSLGKTLWEKAYGGICEASAIYQTKDGGFVLAGYVWGNETPTGGGTMDYLIMKLDAAPA